MKHAFFFLLLIVMPHFVYSQESNVYARLGLGATSLDFEAELEILSTGGGFFDISTGSTSSNTASQTKYSYFVGIGVEAPFQELSDDERGLGYMTELMFSDVGGTFTDLLGSPFSETSDLEYSILQITVPMYLTYHFSQKSFVYAGGYIDYVVSATETFSNKDAISNGEEELYSTSNMNAIDIGISGGVTYSLTDKLFVDVRFYKGITDIFSNSDKEETEFLSSSIELGMQSTFIQIGVGYWFDTGTSPPTGANE